MESFKCNTSNFGSNVGIAFIGIDAIDPTPISIKLSDLEAIEGNVITVKLSQAKQYPYLPVTLTYDGSVRNMIFFGAQAQSLIDSVKLERSGDNELKGFMSFSKGKFQNEEGFVPESETQIDPETLTFPELKKYAKDAGVPKEDIKAAKTKEDLLEVLSLYA